MVRSAAFLAIALGAFCLGDVAQAADPPPMVVIHDKAQVIRLPKPVHRVIVGNPAIADVTLETPRILYIFGKTLGETNLVALGDDDRPILSRSLVVTTEPSRGVAVHVPGPDGPSIRAYSGVEGRCLRVPSPETTSAAAGAPAAPAGMAPEAGMPQPEPAMPQPAEPAIPQPQNGAAGGAAGTVPANPTSPAGR